MPRRLARQSTAKNVVGTDSSKEGEPLGICDCGGEVRGIYDFDRWFSWCEKCSPVTSVRVPLYGDPVSGPLYPTCAKCGCDTKGETALVGDQIWCHPCADAVGGSRHD